MCLYPKLIENPKYRKNKKNGGVIPHLHDKRAAYVPIGCQKCMECRKQKARTWQVRLMEDIKEHTNGKFVTMTFSDEEITKLYGEIWEGYEGYDIDNAIATLAVRRFLERWRWKYKKSLRHWLVTELGQTSSERIHIHGIIWTDEPKATVEEIWAYGNMGWKKTWQQERNYVNARTVNYIIKYVSKSDEKHPQYKSKILTSSGIGKHYLHTNSKNSNKYNGTETKDHYRLNNGRKTSLPIYYRNAIYTEKEREQLWMQRLDKEERYVNGIKVSVKNGYDTYYKTLEIAREENKKLGYGDDENTWEQELYEKNLRNIKYSDRSYRRHQTRQPHGGGGKKPPHGTRADGPPDGGKF